MRSCLTSCSCPGMDGIEATCQIVGSATATRALILTTFDLDEHVYHALRAGAAGCLLKDAGRERIVAAVESTAAGETPMSASVLASLIENFASRPPSSVTRPKGRIRSVSGRPRCCR